MTEVRADLAELTAGVMQNHVAVVKATVTWVDIARTFKYDEHWTPSIADIMKSALLRRLLMGQEPLKVPPPRAYSYPWYKLIDSGRDYFLHLEKGGADGGVIKPYGRLGEAGDYMVICQDPSWKIIGMDADDNFKVTYTGKDIFCYRPLRDDEEHPQCGFTVGTEHHPAGPMLATHVFERQDTQVVW